MSATCDVCMYNIYITIRKGPYALKQVLLQGNSFFHLLSSYFSECKQHLKCYHLPTSLKSTGRIRSSSSKRMCRSPVQLDLILSLCSCAFIISLYNICIIICWLHVLISVPATGEVEPLKKQYTKLLDAYGCLGVLSLNTGQTAAGELMKKHS